jgi:hypothetical protein
MGEINENYSGSGERKLIKCVSKAELLASSPDVLQPNENAGSSAVLKQQTEFCTPFYKCLRKSKRKYLLRMLLKFMREVFSREEDEKES